MTENKRGYTKTEKDIRWKYKEGFMVSLGLLFSGFAVEYFAGNIKVNLSWPFNMYCGAVFISLLVFINFYYRGYSSVRWLSSKYASVSVISTFSFIVLLIGFIPQNSYNVYTVIGRLGLNKLISSWPFFIILMYFLFVLGLVILRKLIPPRRKNTGFILNHTGLWIIVFAGGLGSGDLKRLVMETKVDVTVWYAYDGNNKVYEMPLAIKLLNFDIEEYNPRITVVNKFTGNIAGEKSKNISTIEKGKNIIFPGFNITIEEFYKDSYWIGNSYKPVKLSGAAPSALVNAVNTNSGDTIKGWITSGSYKLISRPLQLDEKHLLAMLPPEPKKYSSEVQIYTKSGFNKKTVVEVNKPYKIMGWNLYQLSYNQKMGKWSDTSIIELVRDPWLPVVYAGIFMLIAGAVFMWNRGWRP